jgi:hypothetical protein
MKRFVYLVLAITFLMLSSGVVAQTEDSEIPPLSQDEQGSISGGEYQLTRLVWQISGSVSGGAYRLAGQAVPSLQGSGCCCTYLPCVLNNAP